MSATSTRLSRLLPISRLGNATSYRRLTGNLFRTMGTAILIQAGLFATGPLVARMLGVEDRGYLASLALWPTIIGTIAIWGLPTAITFEWSARGPLSSDLLKKVASIAAVQAVVAMLIHLAILVFVTDDVWQAARAASIVSLLLGPAFILRDYTLAPLQGARAFTQFNLARISQILCYVPLVALLYLLHRGTLFTISLASVVSGAAISVTALIFYTKSLRSTTNNAMPTSLKSLITFGTEAHFGRLMPIERFRADQVAVALFLSPYSLGIYAVAVAFTNVIRFLTQAIGYVAFPTVAGASTADASARLVRKYVLIAALFSCTIIAVLMIAGPWLISILYGDAFQDAGETLRLLLPGVGIVSIRRVLAESLRGGGLARVTSMSEVATTLVFLALFYPMLRLWSINGIALTVTIAEAAGLTTLGILFRRNQNRLNRGELRSR